MGKTTVLAACGLLALVLLAASPFPSPKLVVIRVDDVWALENNSLADYGYTFDRLERLAGVIEQHGCRGVLGVTPFIYDEQKNRTLALENDERVVLLVKRLNSQGWELAQHGFAHCGEPSLCSALLENKTNIQEGRAYLHGLLNVSIVSYVDPHGKWKPGTLQAVRELDFLVAAVGKNDKVGFDGSLMIEPKSFDVVSSWNGWFEKRFPFKPLDDWKSEFESRDVMILVLHYNAFDSEEKFELLNTFLDFVEKRGAHIVTYKELRALLAS